MNNKGKWLLLVQFICLMLVQLALLYFIDVQLVEQRLLAIIVFSVMIIAFFTGTLGGLIFSLIIIFCAGSLLLLQSTTKLVGNWQTISNTLFIQFGVVLILTILLAGMIQEKITELFKQVDKYKRELEQFVSIDSETSFDTSQRMEIEVKREMNRVNRHGGTFILLMLQIDFYQEFLQTYGNKELQHLLESIGAKINKTVRNTDRKFRVKENRLAILLIETDKNFIEIIIGNLSKQLNEHELLNGKKVTISFHMSYEAFNREMTGVDYETFITNLENEIIFYAM